MPESKAVDLIGSTEVAALTGLDVRTVHRKALAGEIPVVQKLHGSKGQWLFDRAQIAGIATKLADEAEERARRIREAVSS